MAKLINRHRSALERRFLILCFLKFPCESIVLFGRRKTKLSSPGSEFSIEILVNYHLSGFVLVSGTGTWIYYSLVQLCPSNKQNCVLPLVFYRALLEITLYLFLHPCLLLNYELAQVRDRIVFVKPRVPSISG